MKKKEFNIILNMLIIITKFSHVFIVVKRRISSIEEQ